MFTVPETSDSRSLLERLAASKSMSLLALSVAVDVPRTSLRRKLHNPESLTMGELARVAKALEVRACDLFIALTADACQPPEGRTLRRPVDCADRLDQLGDY